MDESAIQAVQIGVNVVIFVVALTISLTLLLGVRDVAERAIEYDASLPTGSRTLVIDDVNQRTIKGYELLSYYTRYMSKQVEGVTSGKYIFTIENKEGTSRINGSGSSSNLVRIFRNIDLSSDYEIITQTYDSEDQVLEVLLKEI